MTRLAPAALLASAALMACFASAPAHAADIELGVDIDAAFAYGSTLNGPGGGLAGRVAVGGNPLKLGPLAIQVMVDFKGTFWTFPDADDGASNMIMGGVGGRATFTLAWLRLPKDNGGRGRGIRLDVPVTAHGLVGTLNDGRNFTPGGDVSVGLAIGLLPVEFGIHVGAGVLAANQNATGLDGTVWANTGIDVGLIF
ncbi:MAG: hypothetical protein ACI9MC_000530 [Kiritimatiellia bacterium]|jgi:hypothetical protein